MLTGITNNDIRTDFKMAAISIDNALKRCTTCSSHEPITLSEDLPYSRVTAFLLTSLFLELFRREFRKSFKFHKPVTKTLSRQNDIFVLLMTFTFLFWYLIPFFAGKSALKKVSGAKIYRSVKIKAVT